MELKILTSQLLEDYIKAVNESPLVKLDNVEKLEIQVDYFQFYKSALADHLSNKYIQMMQISLIDMDQISEICVPLYLVYP